MKTPLWIFASVALASAMFFACSPEKPNTECLEDPEACALLYYSSDAGYEEPSQPGNSSSTGNSNPPPVSSSISTATPSSASGGNSSVAAGVSSARSSSSVRSSSSAATPVSSSAPRSSSSAAATAACVVRTNGMPSNPTSTCFRGEGNSAGKCYICPSDPNCTNSGFWSNWGWDNSWPSQGWLTEVACSGTVGGTSSQSSGGTSSATVVQSSQSQGNSTYTPKPAGSSQGQTTQYWDACKPSCSWSGKGGLQANSCNITGGNIGHNDSDRSACDGGTAFTCMNQAPWKVGNVSFGYVAVNDGACGDCYQLDFPNGHVMVVMKSNIGSINGKFDIMIPGGGVGDFDALTRQVQNSGVSNPDMGARYGGFRLACNNSVSCVRDKCNSVFAKLPDLKAGCLWYVDNLGTNAQSFDNPTVRYQKVDCPAELRNKY